METFVEQFLAGKIELDAVDDFVDAWHGGNSLSALSSFLGMTNDEYQQWIIDPAGFAASMNRRRETGLPYPLRCPAAMPIKTSTTMHQLEVHKKSVLHYWKTQQEENPDRFDTDANALIPDVMQWLGIYEDQLPGVTPADARSVLLDWRAIFLSDRVVAPGRPEG